MKSKSKTVNRDAAVSGKADRFRRTAEARLPTSSGNFRVIAFEDMESEREHLAIISGNVAGGERVLVRIHSECLTGDALGSLRCDCGEQLKKSLEIISRRRKGILLYLRQEGRGIGLMNKLMAYHIQDLGADTVEANLILGFEPDERSYDAAAFILRDLGVKSVMLLTNNPDKINSMKSLGIKVAGRIPLVVGLNKTNIMYVATKKRKMNHMIDEKQLSLGNAVKRSFRKGQR
ncbi:MAG: GTP cyclohydrolase II [Thermoplasmata archaeon]|nr:GTP cyclohydrolase II [Candidatus Sysuiplasma jiujiangense]